MIVNIPSQYYQQYSTDMSLEVPAEGITGWKTADLDVDLDHTALAVMHAWDLGTYDEHPGLWRSAEYYHRAVAICRDILAPLLAAVRKTPMTVCHIVGGNDYWSDTPGYQAAVALAGDEPPRPEPVPVSDTTQALHAFRGEHTFVGPENRADFSAALKDMTFPADVRPVGDEPVAATAHQLGAVCRARGIDHIIYTGFAINWCLLMSPGGMVDMQRRGVMCSTIRQATTAVENAATARTETAKAVALWRVGQHFGFVYDLDDFLAALHRGKA